MLVSCRYCNSKHNRGAICPNRPKTYRRKKEANYITVFRSSNLWKKKREEIKKKDLYLCQYCLKNGKYTFQKLEVHHIESIAKKWNRRLLESNLITLCSSCHKMAEMGEISESALKGLIKRR
jgi:5-methylcytosine-specific restriction enzyme A